MSLTKEQVEFRKSGLGGSDAGIVLGVSSYKDPLTLYLEKRGEVEIPYVETRFQRWGHLHEESIAQAYMEDTGYKVVRSNISHRSKTHPFMIAHLDRKVRKAPNKRLLECKSSALIWEWGEAGTEDIPPSYMAQCQHYLHVTESDQIDVAALLGGNDFRIYPIMRNENFIKLLVEAEEEFWDRVLAGVKPAADWESASTTRLLTHLYPGTNGSVVRLPPVAQKYHEVCADANTQKLMYEKVVTGCQNRIKMMMGEASVGILPDGTIYTRKEVQRKGFTVEPTSYMSFTHTTRIPKDVQTAIADGTAPLVTVDD